MRKYASFSGLKNLPASHSALAKRSPQIHKVDVVFLTIVLLLSAFGLLMIYDSSQVQSLQDFGNSYYYIKQQIIWFILGLGALGFFSILDYHQLKKVASLALGASLLLLILVFVPGLGILAGGAHRWLKLGPLTIQPTEIVKLSAIIFFSASFEKRIKLAPFAAVSGIIIAIVAGMQKDLGSAIVFAIIALVMYFAADAPLGYLLLFLMVGGLGSIGLILSSAYRRQRILAFLNPFSDPQGFSYHISQVLIALGSGGLFGLGIGQSRQKFAYIPEVTTDSIFSVIGEEFGFVGGFILICAIGFLILRGLKIAQDAPDNFGKLLAVGLTTWLGAQAIVNLAAMVSLIPLTGVPLPFISYGGSALLANMVAVGILLNISRQAAK